MRRTIFAGLACLAFVAWAGSRAVDIQAGAGIPSSATAGVSLGDSEGCRVSVRALDGGTINGGVLRGYYYDAVLGWTRMPTQFDCTLQANKLLDAGAPSAQLCALGDLQPLAEFGRVYYVDDTLTGADGGTANGFGVDAGQNVPPKVRIECWGRNIP